MLSNHYSHSRSVSADSSLSSQADKRDRIIEKTAAEMTKYGNKNTDTQYASGLTFFKKWCIDNSVDFEDFQIEDYELFIWYCYDYGQKESNNFKSSWLDHKIKAVGRHYRTLECNKRKRNGENCVPEDITITTQSIREALSKYKASWNRKTDNHLKIKDKQFIEQRYNV